MSKRVSSRAIIIEDNKVLLMFRRKIKDGVKKEYYVVPGGGQDENETLEDTVTRELKEELNVDIKILGFLGTVELDDTISNYYHCSITKGKPMLGGEELDRMTEENYYEPRWVELSEIDNLDLTAKELIHESMDLDLEREMDRALHYTASKLDESGHNSKPVLFHSMKISQNLYNNGYPGKVVIASILHDLLEDTDVTKEELEKEFGKEISDIVESVSFNPNIEDKMEQAKDLFDRANQYGREALLVKCADLIDNIKYVHLGNPKILDKYKLFLDISKDKIGDEKIYKDLENLFKKAISLH